MQLKTIVSFAVITAFAFVPARAETAGTVALRTWFNDFIPDFFPNTTTKWQKAFDEGIISPTNFTGSFNGPQNQFNDTESFRAYWGYLSQLIQNKWSLYTIDITQVTSFASDSEGKNGYIMATGVGKGITKVGAKRYKDGRAAAYLIVSWDGQKRVINEWHEVNTPPNYPFFPWS